MAADKKKTSSSAFIDMNTAEDNSDYETEFDDGITSAGGQLNSGTSRSTKQARSNETNEEDGVRGNITKGVANYVWDESRARARKAFSVYGNIDFLRPYYDVEPQEVLNRLAMSLVPRLTSSTPVQPTIPRELYGPTMLVFTLIAMLLFEMKSSGHIVQEGTLMGTAIGTCFGYWLGVSCLLWMTAYVCNSNVSMLQTLHILGYALFGPCVVILLTTLIHPYHDHLFFYAVFLVFGGLSALRLVTVLTSRTQGGSRKIAMAAIVLTLHLLFLFYLHFAYHRVVEELSGGSNEGTLSFKKTGDMEPVLNGLPTAESFKSSASSILDGFSTTTHGAFTKFARKSMKRVLRGGGGGDEDGVGRKDAVDSVTSSMLLSQTIKDLLQTSTNSTLAVVQTVKRVVM